jgi:hypothetical protein
MVRQTAWQPALALLELGYDGDSFVLVSVQGSY